MAGVVFACFGGGGDVELAPERVDVGLRVVHAEELHHVVANAAVGAIAAQDEVKVDLEFMRSVGRLLVLVCLGAVRSLR